MQRRFVHRLNSSPLAPGDLQLQVEKLSLGFRGVTALSGVDISVRQGEVLAIIGPNGAGKTSLFNCVSGLYRPTGGRIVYWDQKEHDITRLAPHNIAKLGIARSFQNIELFRHMTVLDNLLAGAHIHARSSLLSCLLYWGRAQREQIEMRRYVEDVIDLLRIEAIRHTVVATLPYGLQKRVELGRALALRPSVLLLDEPLAGMNAEEKEDMARFILDVSEEHGVTTILIEHDMGVVMDISDRVCVLDFGRKIAEGTPAEIRDNDAVIKAYLGEASAGAGSFGDNGDNGGDAAASNAEEGP